MSGMKDAKVLVVGGAGFVGSNLVRSLLPHEPKQIIVVDNLLSAECENLPEHSSIQFIHASINDDAVLKNLPSDLNYVFHLATFHGNQSSIADPLRDHENNTLTSLKLFNHIREFKQLKKVVYASAGCVVAEKTFDGAVATTEETTPSMYLDSPYQISKIIGEYYGNYFYKRYGMPFVKARFQNIYGPGEVLGAGEWRGTINTIWRNVIPTMIYQALHEMPLTVENGGIATRDFVFVEDLAQGLLCCALAGNVGEVYNLASGEETSILNLATTINQITKNPTPIALKPKRDWDNSGQRFGNPDKAENEIGFKADTALITGLEKTVAWTKDNLEFIQQCIDKHKSKVQY